MKEIVNEKDFINRVFVEIKEEYYPKLLHVLNSIKKDELSPSQRQYENLSQNILTLYYVEEDSFGKDFLSKNIFLNSAHSKVLQILVSFMKIILNEKNNNNFLFFFSLIYADESPIQIKALQILELLSRTYPLKRDYQEEGFFEPNLEVVFEANKSLFPTCSENIGFILSLYLNDKNKDIFVLAAKIFFNASLVLKKGTILSLNRELESISKNTDKEFFDGKAIFLFGMVNFIYRSWHSLKLEHKQRIFDAFLNINVDGMDCTIKQEARVFIIALFSNKFEEEKTSYLDILKLVLNDFVHGVLLKKLTYDNKEKIRDGLNALLHSKNPIIQEESIQYFLKFMKKNWKYFLDEKDQGITEIFDGLVGVINSSDKNKKHSILIDEAVDKICSHPMPEKIYQKFLIENDSLKGEVKNFFYCYFNSFSNSKRLPSFSFYKKDAETIFLMRSSSESVIDTIHKKIFLDEKSKIALAELATVLCEISKSFPNCQELETLKEYIANTLEEKRLSYLAKNKNSIKKHGVFHAIPAVNLTKPISKFTEKLTKIMKNVSSSQNGEECLNEEIKEMTASSKRSGCALQ